MKNRSIILTGILSLLGCGALSCVAQAADPSAAKRGSAPVSVVNTPNVNVANTTTNPVPIIGTIADAENPARQAVQQGVFFNFTSPIPGNAPGGSQSIPIPAGKIFVLEFVSFQAFLPAQGGGTNGIVVAITITVDGPWIDGSQASLAYPLVIPPPTFTNASTTFISGSQAMRLYAQPGTNLVVSVS